MVALFWVLSLPVQGVVINSVTGVGNTNAPIDDPGWNYVGYLNGASGIYLGSGWVLTASHVGPGNFTLGGISYAPLSNSTVQITNTTPGKTTNTDLIMFQLASTPAGLGQLTLSSAPPTLGGPVTMIGAGRDRGAFTEWSINQATTPWTWTEVSSGGNAAGYQTLSSNTMRWGTNSITNASLWVSVDVDGPRDVRSFATLFDTIVGDEAQAVLGDSGGAVFQKNGSAWELGGVIFTVAGFSGQPSAATTPIYGNATYSADLSYYAPQILSVVPEPSTYALLALSAAGLGAHVLRRRRK